MFRLTVVTDRSRSNRPLTETVRLALEGGADAVQLRERGLTDRQLFSIAEELRRITADAGAALLVNHRPDVAIAADADGVHLGWRSLRVKEVRKLAGDKLVVGVSCHNEAQVRAAEAAGADYVLLGPVFFTPSKRGLVEALGLEKLRELVSAASVPVIAIGGIGPDNAGEVLRTGVKGVAAVSAIMSADDPAEAARGIIAARPPATG